MTRRILLAAIIAAAFAAGRVSASRPAQAIPAPETAFMVVAPSGSRTPERTGTPSTTALPSSPTAVAPPSQQSKSDLRAGTAVSGIASTYGPGYTGLTASRWPRGTVLRICGPAACVTRTTNDYGPAKATGRLLDLDVPTFETVSGRVWTVGLVRVVVWIIR